MKVTYPTIGLIVLLLSSCTFTPYNTDFECPLEKGVPCTRLSKINRMVDRGELGFEEEDSPHGLSCNGSCSVKSLSRETPIAYFHRQETPVSQDLSGPQTLPEETQNVPTEENINTEIIAGEIIDEESSLLTPLEVQEL